MSLLEAEGLVSVRSGEHNSVRYRIGSPVTNEVTPQTPSSEGVTAEFTRDRDATITELNSRRSTGDKKILPTRTAREFLVAYLTSNADAEGWVKVSQVRTAAESEGHTFGGLKRARLLSTEPVIESSRTGPNSKWRIARRDADQTA